MNGQETKKPFYKTFWFYVIVIPLVLYLIGKYTPGSNKPSENTSNKSASTQTNDIEQKMGEWAEEVGNLHKATVRTWRNSTYSNRWHTAGDWFTAITRAINPDLQGKLDKLNNEQWLATVQECSKQLEICISEIASEEKLWGGTDSLVAEIASICYAKMYMSD